MRQHGGNAAALTKKIGQFRLLNIDYKFKEAEGPRENSMTDRSCYFLVAWQLE